MRWGLPPVDEGKKRYAPFDCDAAAAVRSFLEGAAPGADAAIVQVAAEGALAPAMQPIDAALAVHRRHLKRCRMGKAYYEGLRQEALKATHGKGDGVPNAYFSHLNDLCIKSIREQGGKELPGISSGILQEQLKSAVKAGHGTWVFDWPLGERKSDIICPEGLPYTLVAARSIRAALFRACSASPSAAWLRFRVAGGLLPPANKCCAAAVAAQSPVVAGALEHGGDLDDDGALGVALPLRAGLVPALIEATKCLQGESHVGRISGALLVDVLEVADMLDCAALRQECLAVLACLEPELSVAAAVLALAERRAHDDELQQLARFFNSFLELLMLRGLTMHAVDDNFKPALRIAFVAAKRGAWDAVKLVARALQEARCDARPEEDGMMLRPFFDALRTSPEGLRPVALALLTRAQKQKAEAREKSEALKVQAAPPPTAFVALPASNRRTQQRFEVESAGEDPALLPDNDLKERCRDVLEELRKAQAELRKAQCRDGWKRGFAVQEKSQAAKRTRVTQQNDGEMLLVTANGDRFDNRAADGMQTALDSGWS
jgi:hypothetical protein